MKIVYLCVVLLLLSNVSSASEGCGYDNVNCGVSIIQLIVLPKQFDKKSIVVRGYLHQKLNYAGEKEYLLSLQKEFLDYENSIIVSITPGNPQHN